MSDYPVMYLVKAVKGSEAALFKSTDKKQAVNWGKALIKRRTARQNLENPICLVQSQFLGFIDTME